MEEDDHDELLQGTDDESLSENEDQCLPIDKPEENERNTLIYFNHTKFEFLLVKVLLVFSVTGLLILLPLYLETINVNGDAYSMLLTSNFIITIFLLFIIFMATIFCSDYKHLRIFNLPMKFFNLLQLSIIYIISGFMIIYSLDRKRVSCHLQDPIKGIVLVCSLLYYFFFCRKLMGLQRIFSATTIIVGLFIAVDYGLCDEFRCRGYEREKVSDDVGIWNWQTHSIWTTIYICGLALFAGYFTLLDHYLLAQTDDRLESQTNNIASTFLSTVSRSIAHPNSSSANSNREIRSNQSSNDNLQINKKYFVLHLIFWIHILCLVITVLLFWTDMIAVIGKGSNPTEFWNYTTNGLICHFKLPTSFKTATTDCGNVIIYCWFFICFYILFVITAVKLLIFTQSAVYTVATMTAALPIIGIWWSLFHLVPIENGLLIWAPSVTGELICSLLGLPIIFIGLFIMCKSHFKDYQWSRLANMQHVMSTNNFA